MMKLGTETGSLVNHIYSQTQQTLPRVGDGATILSWTDRHAGTVIDVHPTTDTIVVQEDTAKVISGSVMDGSAVYEYQRNPNGATYTFKPVSRGKAKGLIREGGRKDGRSVIFGRRDQHRDPSF